MDILIDNINLQTQYNIICLDYTPAFGVAAIREDARIWNDKSGVDRNLSNARYEAKEFVLHCLIKADNIQLAREKISILSDYMLSKRVFVLSFRDIALNIRECFLCERLAEISPTINVRSQNTLFAFELGLRDVNPNAIKYYTTAEVPEGGDEATITIDYTKGQSGMLYWGDGEREEVSNSQEYTTTRTATESYPIDVIIDVDKDAEEVDALTVEFSADVTSGVKEQTVQFTDESTGDITLWSWNFGDGGVSSEQNPTHIYTTPGTFTVTLQVFNAVSGSATMSKVNYITIRNSRLLINGVDSFKINSNDKLLKN